MTKLGRVGHAGTLDPAAEGVLVIAFNRATRLIPFLPTDKSYHAIVRLGITTDSLDAVGTVQQKKKVPDISATDIAAALQRFVGPQMQKPPLISARHHQGIRLYQRARMGEVIEPTPTAIEFYRLQLLSWQSPDIEFEVDCSRGTYIRSLARDLGACFGCGAHLYRLQRTLCSGFSLEESLSWESLENILQHGCLSEVMVSPAQALRQLPDLTVEKAVQQAVQNGCRILLPESKEIYRDTWYRILDLQGRLLAIARPEAMEMKMERVLCPSDEERL